MNCVHTLFVPIYVSFRGIDSFPMYFSIDFVTTNTSKSYNCMTKNFALLAVDY